MRFIHDYKTLEDFCTEQGLMPEKHKLLIDISYKVRRYHASVEHENGQRYLILRIPISQHRHHDVTHDTQGLPHT